MCSSRTEPSVTETAGEKQSTDGDPVIGEPFESSSKEIYDLLMYSGNCNLSGNFLFIIIH